MLEKWRGGGSPEERFFKSDLQWNPEIASKEFGVQARNTAPRHPYPHTGVKWGTPSREKLPHSKNMSTNSKWTPGCSPPFECSFSLSATAGALLSPLGLQEPGSFFPEKGGAGNFEGCRQTPLGV